MLNTDSVEELKQGRGRRQREFHLENVICRFCNHFSIIRSRLTGKMGAVYPGIKLQWAVWRWKEKKQRKICRQEFTSSLQRLHSSFQVENWTRTAEKCTKPEKRTCKTAVVNTFGALCKFVTFFSPLLGSFREFKKLRQQLQRARHIKIDFALLTVLLLCHVGHVVQNRQSALSRAWHEWFLFKGKKWKIFCYGLALSPEPQIWKFHAVVGQTTSKHYNKKRAARAARLFFFIQPIKSSICGVVIAVVKS